MKLYKSGDFLTQELKLLISNFIWTCQML